MKKKFKTLILPYITWVTLYIIVYYIGQSVSVTRQLFLNPDRNVANMSFIDYVGAYIGFVGGGLFVNALWFLRDLIILNIFAVIIKKIVDIAPLLTLFFVLILWFIGGPTAGLGINANGIVFFVLGYYLVRYKINSSESDKYKLWEIICIYVFLIALEFYYYKSNSLLKIPTHGFSSIIGVLLVVKTTGIIIKNDESIVPKGIEIIALFSFFVYASHDLVQTVYKKLLSKALPNGDLFQLIEYMIIPIMTCWTCVLLALMVKKLVPPLFLLLTGDRKKRLIGNE